MSNVVNTGMQRAVELTINKLSGMEPVTGYPRVYKLRDAFGNFRAWTPEELAGNRIEEYKARLAAFVAYVESVEVGVKVDTAGTYVENRSVCPV